MEIVFKLGTNFLSLHNFDNKILNGSTYLSTYATLVKLKHPTRHRPGIGQARRNLPEEAYLLNFHKQEESWVRVILGKFSLY